MPFRSLVAPRSSLSTPKDCSPKPSATLGERPVVHYVDLPVYGTPMSLARKLHRMRCVNRACPKRTWVLGDHRIAAKNCLLTTRAAKWATVQVGGGRTVSEMAAELSCDWHTVNDAVSTYGEALLGGGPQTAEPTRAIGLDETSFVKSCDQVHADYATTVADVENHQNIEILPTRKYVDVAGWIDKQPKPWKERIRFGALDMSATYAAVYSVMLPQAHQVVDPFHVICPPTAASMRSVAVCRPNRPATGAGETTRSIGPGVSCPQRRDARRGGRGASVVTPRAGRPRRRGGHRLSDEGASSRLLSDTLPRRGQSEPRELESHCRRRAMPPEVQRLGRTLEAWFEKIANFHLARVSNGPTEALNNLIKRIKRIGFGFRNFENYRISALLYAGRPNWRVLGSIVVR